MIFKINFLTACHKSAIFKSTMIISRMLSLGNFQFLDVKWQKTITLCIMALKKWNPLFKFIWGAHNLRWVLIVFQRLESSFPWKCLMTFGIFHTQMHVFLCKLFKPQSNANRRLQIIQPQSNILILLLSFWPNSTQVVPLPCPLPN